MHWFTRREVPKSDEKFDTAISRSKQKMRFIAKVTGWLTQRDLADFKKDADAASNYMEPMKYLSRLEQYYLRRKGVVKSIGDVLARKEYYNEVDRTLVAQLAESKMKQRFIGGAKIEKNDIFGIVSLAAADAAKDTIPNPELSKLEANFPKPGYFTGGWQIGRAFLSAGLKKIDAKLAEFHKTTDRAEKAKAVSDIYYLMRDTQDIDRRSEAVSKFSGKLTSLFGKYQEKGYAVHRESPEPKLPDKLKPTR